ncbi:MAG: hypothetical protein KGJ62_03825 [Armatimonadetes bacterium]|nr:hypothetical protein [Armatimonadota bacterium]MDE2205982.1 hypothetical protein [Armatimonadota bacterium]
MTIIAPDGATDNRRVVLIKSIATHNRFYALVEPDSGIHNADTVSSIPEHLVLGIAYPCLEDGLNDFAVIRTTFETLDVFPADDPIRPEMLEIIDDAKANLLRRLQELADKFRDRKAHFLGTEYTEFKRSAIDIIQRGCPRRNLDSMMKLNVFGSVAASEAALGSGGDDLMYRLEIQYRDAAELVGLSPREFIVGLFGEIIQSVIDTANYQNRYLFDRNVFQKFIAVMFINYATTDPMFYGINKKDYAVSGDRDMDDTPLYVAIGRELRDIEAGRIDVSSAEHGGLEGITQQPTSTTQRLDTIQLPAQEEPAAQVLRAAFTDFDTASELLPSELVLEDVLLGPLTSLCSAASLLGRKNDPETQRFARVVLADASRIVQELKRLGTISELVNDPAARELERLGNL